MTDSSPEAYRDGIQKLDALTQYAEGQGFKKVETATAMSNVRVPAPEPAAGTMANVAAGVARELDKGDKRK